ncbi:MAG TPA: hypothetical protein DEG13_10915, partial [Candidatus Microthrix parvicella]|nr:hypothetical protein [Candidatus Microthrix parvicella]
SELHRVGLDIDEFDGRLDKVDPSVQLARTRPHDLIGMGQCEGDEQDARLVDMAVVLVNDGDRCLVEGVKEGLNMPG